MKVTETAIKGVKIIEPRVFNDARGYFFESFEERVFQREVADVHFVQDNESYSEGLWCAVCIFSAASMLRPSL